MPKKSIALNRWHLKDVYGRIVQVIAENNKYNNKNPIRMSSISVFFV